MEMISLRCKECGGTIEVDSSKNVTFCPYCGSKSIIPESDQVKIARIKAEERIKREKEHQKSKTKREFYTLTLPMIVIFGGLILFGIIGIIFGLE